MDMATSKETSKRQTLDKIYENMVEYSPPQDPLSPDYHTNTTKWFDIVHRIVFNADGDKVVKLPRATKSIYCTYTMWSLTTTWFWSWWWKDGEQWTMTTWYVVLWYLIYTSAWRVIVKSITTTHITFTVTNYTWPIYANLYCY